MCDGVDAARQTRGDDVPGTAKLFGKDACQLGARSRALARADDGHDGPVEQSRIAFDVEQAAARR